MRYNKATRNNKSFMGHVKRAVTSLGEGVHAFMYYFNSIKL